MNENPAIATVGDFRCYGSVCENLHCFWKVDNFSSLYETAVAVCQSDPIPSVERGNVRWYLLLFPGGEPGGNEGTVEFHLSCFNRLDVSINAKLSFHVRNSKNDVIAGSEPPKWVVFGPGMTSKRLETPIDTFLDQIQDDTVVIAAEIIYSRSVARACETTRFLSELSPCVILAEEYSNLPERMENDTVVVVDDTEIPAHSTVLAASSSVFADSLDPETVQSRSGRIEIVDFGHDVVKSMLDFLYSGTVFELNKPLALNLIEIGKKYELSNLISHCTGFLASQLDQSNVVELLFLADDLGSFEEIRKQAMKYICEDVSATDFKSKFTSLKEYRKLLFEILIRMKQLDPA